MLNALGLLAALVLTIAVALPMSLSMTEMEEVRWLFSREGALGCVGR